MAKTKTTYTRKNVIGFINSNVDNEMKKADSFRLIELMQKWSGSEPKMWGPTIIGFGNYHYKYASGHEGDAQRSKLLLNDLGKFKMGKACIYVKKLSDINISVLQELSIESIKYINEHHESSCRIKQTN